MVQNLRIGIKRKFQHLMLLVPGAAENERFTGALADTLGRAIAIPFQRMPGKERE